MGTRLRWIARDAVAALVLAAGLVPCACAPRGCGVERSVVAAGPDTAVPDTEAFRQARLRMVATQIEARGVRDPAVLDAMRAEPRHAYVPADVRAHAYADHPLPIGHGQTISQPFIVALMSAALDATPGSRVLEVGTGSGYQAAVLDRLGAEVYTIEIVEPLCERARRDLASNGHGRVKVRCGDGYRGWPEAAPFERIIVTAAPDHVPEPLVAQLKPGGVMVLPVGTAEQWLVRLVKSQDGTVSREPIEAVRFVPMTGEAGGK
jgi:protein-L-isoaspartate(D-aspartate) O-methyltransferase